MLNSRLIKAPLRETIRTAACVSGISAIPGILRPISAGLSLTCRCNSRCSMCDFWRRKLPQNELTLKEIEKILYDLRTFGIRTIAFNAEGEVFMREDIFDILAIAEHLGFMFSVNTNGLALSDPVKAKSLAKSGVFSIPIGIDSPDPKEYEKIRGVKGGLEKVVAGIKNLQNAGCYNVTFGAVVLPSNIFSLVPLAELARDLDVQSVRYTAYQREPFQSSSSSQLTWTESSIRTLEQELDRLLQWKRTHGIIQSSDIYLRSLPAYYATGDHPHLHCFQGTNRIEISHLGDVRICSFLPVVGNILTSRTSDIWRKAETRRSVRDAYRRHCPDCWLSCYAEESLRIAPVGLLRNNVELARRFLRLASKHTVK